MTLTASETEPHPFLHDFTVVNDAIIDRNSRKVPVLIKREERCEFCNTRRFTRINVRQWTQVGKRQYKYDRRQVIVRVTREAHLRQLFLASTSLNGSDLQALS